MKPPIAFDADSVREQKVQVFRSIRPMSVEDVIRFTVRGQYGSGVIDGKRVPGYREEPGVNRNSVTETYAAVRFQIENWRWAGVPFYIRTGKRLARNLTEIRVHLEPTPQALFASTSSAGADGDGSSQLLLSSELWVEGAGWYETLLLDSMRGGNAIYAPRRSRGGAAHHYAD